MESEHNGRWKGMSSVDALSGRDTPEVLSSRGFYICWSESFAKNSLCELRHSASILLKITGITINEG